MGTVPNASVGETDRQVRSLACRPERVSHRNQRRQLMAYSRSGNGRRKRDMRNDSRESEVQSTTT